MNRKTLTNKQATRRNKRFDAYVQRQHGPITVRHPDGTVTVHPNQPPKTRQSGATE